MGVGTTRQPLLFLKTAQRSDVRMPFIWKLPSALLAVSRRDIGRLKRLCSPSGEHNQIPVEPGHFILKQSISPRRPIMENGRLLPNS
jgi:hypothetical protein